jgi:hypothetical protein
MSAARSVPLEGEAVYRIHWVPGTDRLMAVCFCGTPREFEDPVQLWDWLLGHPEADPAGHRFLAPPTARTDTSAPGEAR